MNRTIEIAEELEKGAFIVRNNIYGYKKKLSAEEVEELKKIYALLGRLKFTVDSAMDEAALIIVGSGGWSSTLQNSKYPL